MCLRICSIVALCFSFAPAAVPAQGVEPVLHATCKITNPASTATCFLVSETATRSEPAENVILVTAAHVLEQATGDMATLVARKAGPDDTYVRLDIPLAIREQNKPLWIKHPSADVAVLRVKLPADCACRPLPLTWIASEQKPNDERFRSGGALRILTYPAQLAANDAGFPIIRSGLIASFPLRPVKQYGTFVVDCSSFGGDSGGPAFVPAVARAASGAADAAEPPSLVVGLVSGQHRQTETVRTVFEERVIHHSLGLAIVVQAALIRETIAQLSK